MRTPLLKFFELSKPDKGRLWGIDATRGLVIILMVIANFAYDLYFFRNWQINIYEGFWWTFPRAILALFVFLAGISLTLSYRRVRHKSKRFLLKKYIARGLKIFLWGMAITAVTWFLLPRGVILFGVLHLIGIGIILAYPFLRISWLRRIAPWLGVILIALGIWLQNQMYEFSFLFWLGLMPRGLYTFDYTPLLPWFGVLLLGLWVGNYINPRTRSPNTNISLSPPIKFLRLLGRNSLLIYLLHQPIFVGLLWLFG